VRRSSSARSGASRCCSASALALPDPWVAELEALAAETVVGRLFCADCFENWRFGAVDDVLSTRVAAAVRRLRARDAALEVLDLRGEGPLDGDAAGVLLCGIQPLVWVVLTKLQNSLARSNRSRFG